ncbi:MAG TPA: hypothetical protein VHN98_05420 [Acidimicrobiales bacterium]|nr:hypothetical protein [Acidimicrobiales bacterium]
MTTVVAPPSVRAAGRPATSPSPALAPPAAIPLGFLAASGAGLAALGAGLVVAARTVAAVPTAPHVVAVAHLCMLGFLVTGVLGALHQFVPVVGGRRLRSNALAALTLAVWVPAVAGIVAGFALDVPGLVAVSGAAAFAALAAAGVNLSAPLAYGTGTPVTGLRWAVALLVATAGFGVVYAFDRQAGWFPLFPVRVLAHAHLGLLGALGLAYVAVAEKLWPMFLLAHRPGRGPGALAVRLLPAGVLVLVGGLLVRSTPAAIAGATVACAGLGAHLASLAGFIRHRRRKLELLHAFVLTGAVALVSAVVLGAASAFAPVGPLTRMHLAAAEIAGLAAWLGLAIVGHSHKIVPFISYTALRARGVSRNGRGGPLLFADLYDARLARVSYAAATAGFALLIAGLATAGPVLVAAAGALIVGCAVVTLLNLVTGPIRAGAWQ